MPKIYTTNPGAVIEIGHYGPATNTVGAEVPEKVARELAGRADLRVEPLPSTPNVVPVREVEEPVREEPVRRYSRRR